MVATAAVQQSDNAQGDGGWSVSYSQAVKEASTGAQAKPDRLDSNWYTCGNNNSTPFFRKMQQSIEEAERLRQQCRAASSVSAARNDEVKAEMNHFQRSIGDAKASAEFSRAAALSGVGAPGGAEAQVLAVADAVVDRDAPVFLGHLSVPRPAAPEDTAGQARGEPLAGAGPGEAAAPALPGMIVDAEEDRVEDQAPGGRDAGEPPASRSPPRDGTPEAAPGQPVGHQRSGRSNGSQDSQQSSTGESPQDRPNLLGDASEDNISMSSDSETGSSEESDRWPPRPPLLKFKNRVQFSGRFVPSAAKKILEKANEEAPHAVHEGELRELKDMTIGWVNKVFELNVCNEYQFEIGFPIIILSMLDAVYANRVRWREINWKFQYKRAIEKNFQVLERIWGEVNMEKAREFRVENTSLRMENMSSAPVKEKLEFLRLAKRWFDTRIHHAEPYDPKAKRHEIVKQCKQWGHDVRFPSWIRFDKDAEPPRIAAPTFYERMPEYKRLIWFLGSPEHQKM